MNVYDFDKTIYDGDSSVDFFLFCLAKKPTLVIYSVKQAFGVGLGIFKFIPTKKMKEMFFSFLNGVNDADRMAEMFWDKNSGKIKDWYFENKKDDDVIISASPEFMLRPICNRLGISGLLATEMNKKTGEIYGENCKSKEKVKRFYDEYPEGVIENFYSDSLSDLPLAILAEKAFLVKGNNLSIWEK